jgi:FAD:protein FMN transferase
VDVNRNQQRERPNQPVKPRRSFAPFIFIIALAVLTGTVLFFINRDAPGVKTYNYHHLAMDTTIELRLQAESRRDADAVKDEVFAEMERLEKLLSRTLSGSDVDRINRAAGREALQVSPETMAVAQAALAYARLSEGAFDPTIAPLLNVWGFLDQQYRVPEPGEIEAALPLVDYTLLELDPQRGTIYLPAGMSLDLGGIAKGYILDRGLAVLSRSGIRHAFLNAGGDIALLGVRPDGTPWRIGVRHPRRENQYIAVVPLSGMAVVTSGDYERTFEEGSVRYHHILDPSTGQPALSLSSVTIVAPTTMEADALSTAIFVLGPERGLALVEHLPGVEAVLVTAEMEILISSGLQDTIELQ